MEQLAINGGVPVREKPLSYGHQYIDEDDIAAVTEVLKSDFLTCGPQIGALEKKLCSVTGAKYSVVCANGTAALHIAVQAAGLKEGDELITTPMTFAASANCGLYVGARPVFADIDPDTWNIDPAKVKDAVTNKTKAIVPVDYTGQAVQLDELKEIAASAGAYLIEDAAHAIGTLYKGRPVGSIADMTTFSFHPIKTVTGGEGGAVLTNDEGLYKKLLLFRSHGITRDPSLMKRVRDGHNGGSEVFAEEFGSDCPWYYEQVALGMNYRMTDMQAALVNSQLNKLEQFKARRKEIVDRYNDAFGGVEGLIIQKEIKESDTARHLYVLRFDTKKLGLTRKEIFRRLWAEGVHGNVNYIPVHRHPYYEALGYKEGLCPVAESLYEEIISLPLYYGLTDGDVEDVIRAVIKVLV